MLRFDYTTQAWIRDGKYIDCGHPKAMICGCFGRVHKGEVAPASKVPNYQMGGAVMAKHTPGPYDILGVCNTTNAELVVGLAKSMAVLAASHATHDVHANGANETLRRPVS